MRIEELADKARARGIRRIAYFHCDHFEPWGSGVNATSLRAVDRFRQMTERSPYGARLSLFYSTYNGYSLDDGHGQPNGECVPGDKIYFANHTHRTRADNTRIVQAIRPLVTELGHEMQLHVHHEWWTQNALNVESPIWKWVQAHSNHEMDERRLALFIKFACDTISAETGDVFGKWGFVHGNWALNASDDEICRIENEIDLMMQAGGFGDFTFPAGRRHCDPVGLDQPYTCLPEHGRKIYEKPESQPKTIGFGSHAMSDDRFFIWNSPIKAAQSSIDWYYAPNLKVFQDLDKLVGDWLEQSVCYGDTLFLKTHAHSMNHRYGLGTSDTPIPHAHPDIVRAFDHLMRVCDTGRIEFKLVTVNEVMHVLKAIDAAPSHDPRVIDAAFASFRKPDLRLTLASPAIPLLSRSTPIAGEPAQAAHAAPAATRPVSAAHALGLWTAADPERDHVVALTLDGAEAAQMRYIEQTFPARSVRLFMPAAGFGLAAATLAEAGYHVVAFETDQLKCQAIRHLVAYVVSSGSKLGGRLIVVQGGFPDAFLWRDIAKDRTNVLFLPRACFEDVSTAPAQILRAATSFEHVLLETAVAGGEQEKHAMAPHGRHVRAVPGSDFAHFTTVAHNNGRPAASEAKPEGAANDPVDAVALRVKLARRAVPEPAGPVDDLYADKLRRDCFIEPQELAVTHWLVQNFDPRDTRIIEIGCAQGGLSCLLAGLGYETIGFEMHLRRVAMSQALNDEMSRRGSFRPPLFVEGAFPDAIDKRIISSPKRTMVVATNVVNTFSAENEQRMIRSAVLVDDFVIDLGRFCVSRDEASARRDFWRRLSNQHFQPQELLFDQPPYEYWHFTVRPFKNAADARAV